MPTQEQLQKYAKLLIGTGCALKKGQPVLISAPVEIAPFVRLAAKAAWELGAGDVTIQWSDPAIDKLRYQNGDEALFDATPAWEVALLETAAKQGAAVLRLGGGPQADDRQNEGGPPGLSQVQRRSGQGHHHPLRRRGPHRRLG